MDYYRGFFAVTNLGQLYQVFVGISAPSSYVEMILCDPHESSTPIKPEERRLSPAPYLAITQAKGIFYYHNDDQLPSARRRSPLPEKVSVSTWQKGTLPLVGLFLEWHNAFACYNSEERDTLDPRWAHHTKSILEKFWEHPYIMVARQPGLAFPPQLLKQPAAA